MRYFLAVVATFLSLGIFAQMGCTDPVANNYDAQATTNDGSCTYDPVNVFPDVSYDLDSEVRETSGLVSWDGTLYTHNDDNDRNFYSVDPNSGFSTLALDFSIVPQVDWEELAQDLDYFYLGDFGNNENGDRQDLRIYKVLKNSLFGGTIQVDTIEFSYPEQTDFSGTGPNNTDFDCESMVIGTDSIYLFTKEWVSQGTALYSLPKTGGQHQAQLLDHFNVSGLITGASAQLDDRLIVLSGYNGQLEPFFLCLYDFTGNDFLGANKRVLSYNAQFHQIEAISTTDGITYHVTNESFAQGPVNILPKIHTFDFRDYLIHYLDPSQVGIQENEPNSVVVFPNPSTEVISVQGANNSTSYSIWDMKGQLIEKGKLDSKTSHIDIKKLPVGSYTLKLSEGATFTFQKIASK